MRNKHSISAWHLLLSAVLSGLLLTACGDDGTEVAPEDADPAETEAEDSTEDGGDAEDAGGEADTELTVVVTLDPEGEELPDEEREPAEWTLTCGPEGGDHPDPEAACADLEDLDLEEVEEAGGDEPCTMIYGGNAQATVSGHIGETEVDLEFDRTDGCEIHRWDVMGTVLDA
ncbi:hypothetical protein J4H86_16150 [Spiractinospora alimapuensis]|uniref:SSI family serine proteinase inhibitor n=1 Tax=Spiractinospora alimapuensis TaxID=2820884 RepID=UPI001EEAB6F2|nr:SSI family serine proteinase inhibitor [Spiractinospora alimapuensis]QVQ50449.1 hypothetical protein J4H86_16150 [Spiractinospora alimapuensis]